jgi:hypothetical protein
VADLEVELLRHLERLLQPVGEDRIVLHEQELDGAPGRIHARPSPGFDGGEAHDRLPLRKRKKFPSPL